MNQDLAFLAFNRGLISPLALARADIKRAALAAETMNNCMPRVMGSMMLRPGLKYLNATKSNAATRMLPFVFSASDKATIELTNLNMRVQLADDSQITRPAVSTAITNGNFDTNLANWTDTDEVGGVSAWVTGGYMGLTGNGTANAIREQAVTIIAADSGVEHALTIIVERGPVTLMVGSASGGEQYIAATELRKGFHSLSFTPTGTFYVRLQANYARQMLVTSCNIAASGIMDVTTPWLAADLGLIRTDQSGDIIYAACSGYQQMQIERHASRSWSLSYYLANDGPFLTENATTTTMTPAAVSGNTTLTASKPVFKSTHVGALFRVVSTGQTVTKSMTALNDVTNSIRVTGITTDRTFTILITGLSGTGNTVQLQQSYDNAVWTDVPGNTFTTDQAVATNDARDNQIVWYRLKCTVYVGGTTASTLTIATGSIIGVGRVTAYTSSILVDVEVLADFGGTTASDTWAEGTWSTYRGWPSAVALNDSRLWWFGKDKAIGSIIDAFTSFDPDYEGDAGPIQRSIGTGQVDSFNWALALGRLVVGGQGAEFSLRSTTFDEPLTPSNFNIKRPSTQGSAQVQAIPIDGRGVFVQRGGTRVFELALDAQSYTYDYAASDLTAITPEVGRPQIVRIAVQRQPDTRVHCVRSDGTAAVLVYDKAENVTCWITVTSPGASGLIEDVMVLPGDAGENEDHVYYIVKRTIGGATVRYRERWAMETSCLGASQCLLGDAYVAYSGSASVLTGLSHLEGQSVVVWADGVDVGTSTDSDGVRTQLYTVAGGQITLPAAVSVAMVGLYYEGTWQSAKLVQAQTGHGIGLNQDKLISQIGVILANAHIFGLRYGQDFTHLNDMPAVEEGAVQSVDTVWSAYEKQTFTFPGSWDPNSRLCLLMAAPRPCTVLSALISVETS